MTDSETVMVETISYSNVGLTHCLWICKMVVGLRPHFLLTNILKRWNFWLQRSEFPQNVKVILLSKVIPKNFICEDTTKEGRCMKTKQVLPLLQFGTWRILSGKVCECVCGNLCVRTGSKYFRVVSDWLTLVADLCGTLLVGGPLWTQFDDVVVLAVAFFCFAFLYICSVTPFTCRLDGCDVFFSYYVQCSRRFSHADGFHYTLVTHLLDESKT